MKRLVTGLLALSLFLAACGQDSDQQKDSNKEKDDKAKTEQQDKKTNDSSKDKKDNKDDSKDVNKDNKDNSANDNQQQSNSNATNNDQNQTNNNQSSNNQKSSYVAPYYGQNAAPVARQIYPFNGNKTQALQQLPNFQTALMRLIMKQINLVVIIKCIMIILLKNIMATISMCLVLKTQMQMENIQL